MFSGCTLLPDSKETELGSNNQKASPSAGKNTGIILVSRCTLKCIPAVVSGGAYISEVPGCRLLWQMSYQWGSQKLLLGLLSNELVAYLSVFKLFLTQWIMALLSKGCKPDNFEPHNSLKLSFTSFLGLCSNFVECESFLESNSPDILALCKANLDDSIDSGNFFVIGYLPLIRKDLLLISMILQVIWKKNFLLHRTSL